MKQALLFFLIDWFLRNPWYCKLNERLQCKNLRWHVGMGHLLIPDLRCATKVDLPFALWPCSLMSLTRLCSCWAAGAARSPCSQGKTLQLHSSQQQVKSCSRLIVLCCWCITISAALQSLQLVRPCFQAIEVYIMIPQLELYLDIFSQHRHLYYQKVCWIGRTYTAAWASTRSFLLWASLKTSSFLCPLGNGSEQYTHVWNMLALEPKRPSRHCGSFLMTWVSFMLERFPGHLTNVLDHWIFRVYFPSCVLPKPPAYLFVWSN